MPCALTPGVASASSSVVTEFRLPSGAYNPEGITSGPGGELWFTNADDNGYGAALGKITANRGNTERITEITDPAYYSDPVAITEGRDGNLWFADQGTCSCAVGVMRPGNSFSEYTYSGDAPNDITVGPGGNLWFTVPYDYTDYGDIGKITPTGKVTLYRIHTKYATPIDITRGPDGDLWFTFTTGNAGNSRIGRITPSGVITSYRVRGPASSGYGSYPWGIAAGRDGDLWFTDIENNAIGMMTPMGKVVEHRVPSGGYGVPESIVAGPGRSLWFTEADNAEGRARDYIGRVRLDGKITEYRVPTRNSMPDGIAVGPDGNIWFTEFNANQVGRLNVSALHLAARKRP